MALLFSLAVLCLVRAIASWDEEALTVYVDGKSGTDCTQCLNSTLHESCRTLSFVADNLTRRERVRIEIEGEVLNLTEAVEFTSYPDLSISGNNTVIHCNESGAGLAFVGVQRLSIYSLTIERCGAERNSTSVNPKTPNQTECLSVALYILKCKDVSIRKLDVRLSNGTGVSLYDTSGTVDISDCRFIRNGREHTKEKPGGGGVHIEFSLCAPGMAKNCSNKRKQIHDSSYTIRNCKFSANNVHCPPNRQQYISPFSNQAIPRLGRGGGLYVSIGSSATKNNFSIAECVFEGNSASFGGSGMVIEFIDSARNNSVSVTATNFTDNHCSTDKKSLCSGGGLVLDAMFYDHQDETSLPQYNTFTCTQCEFVSNSANIGGGAGVYVTKSTRWHHSLVDINFLDCSWAKNNAPMGAAVFISPGVWDYTREGFVPSPMFANCTFTSNSAVQDLFPRKNDPNVAGDPKMRVMSVGYGAVFVSESEVRFEGETIFIGNHGSAVHLSNSVLSFSERARVTFRDNLGHNGGAVAMFGSSTLQIRNHSSFLFANNSAFSSGGAIYVQFSAPLQPVYHNCFFSTPNFTRAETTEVKFEKNRANVSGTDIFTTTFQPCQLLCPSISTTQLMHPEKILDCVARFNFNNSSSKTLATRPKYFKLLEDTPVEVIPGAEYRLNLSVSDEAGLPLSTVVYEASVKPSDVTIDQAFTQVSNNTICLLGPYNSLTELSLSTVDTFVMFNVTLARCQPGYLPSNHKTCMCNASDYLGLRGCDPTVYIKRGYWMGPCGTETHSKLCTGFCPDGFCSYTSSKPDSGHIALPDKHDLSLLDHSLCGTTRTGTLCGKCALNHSVHFNSFQYTCGGEKHCYLGWLLYVTAEIVPLTVLFFVILFFNVSFTSGNISCFVFYAQVLRSVSFSGNGNIQLPHPLKIIQEIVTMFYNPFNMDFFTTEKLSFCLWKGATFMDVMIMKYVTVSVALALVLLTILCARHGYMRTTLFVKFQASDSILIHGLTAFFVLCYAQSVRTTFHILNFTCIYSEGFVCKRYVVNRMGSMPYFEAEHIKYAVVALFVLVFIVLIPPILLIAYPLVFKLLGRCGLSESKLVNALWRLMPIQFLDAFQSSFKDQYRFFAGLHFLYRMVILGTNMLRQSWLQFYSIVQLQLIIALTVHALFQPHKLKRHNVIDTLLTANLACINIITFYYYATKDFSGIKSSHVVINVLAGVQAFLIVLPLVYAALQVLKLRRFCRRWRWRDYEDLPKLRSSEHDSLLGDW